MLNTAKLFHLFINIIQKPNLANRRRTLSDVNRIDDDDNSDNKEDDHRRHDLNDKVRFLSPVHSEFSSHSPLQPSSSINIASDVGGAGARHRQVSQTSSYNRSMYGSHPTLRRSSEVQEYDFPPSPSPSRHSQQQQQQQQHCDEQNEEGLYIEHDYEFIDDNYFDTFQLEERINVLSRFPDYPFSNTKRDYVPDLKVPWSVSYILCSFFQNETSLKCLLYVLCVK